MKKSLKIFSLILGFLFIGHTALALSGDISINSEDISFSNNSFLEGRKVRIYATAKNNSSQDLLGTVRYYDNDRQIGGDQPISIFAGKNDGVFIDWTPSFGNHKIAVKIFPWTPEIDDPSNNWIVSNIYAIQDTDHDGIPNDQDNDDDGDGVPDNEDFSPLDPKESADTDGDGIGDNVDPDDDNDDVPDDQDDLPLNPNESTDTDKDGIGDIADPDDDNDGITDNEEDKNGTNSKNADTDGDGTTDGKDAFPLDPSEQLDTDNDKIGNNTDIDDDNDGIIDDKDEFPLNKGPVIKINGGKEKFRADLYKNNVFDASPSYDEDGQIVSYIWDIDGVEKEGNSTSHKFKTIGEHKIKLTVVDDKGESRTNNFQVTVLNIGLYKQIIVTLLLLLLASLIYFKYIAGAKNSDKKP